MSKCLPMHDDNTVHTKYGELDNQILNLEAKTVE